MFRSRVLLVPIIAAISLLAPSLSWATIIGVNETFSGALNPSVTATRFSLTGTWPLLSIITSDANNGDGVGDGAMLVDSQSTGGTFGTRYSAGSLPSVGSSITLSTVWWNPNVSFVTVEVQIYNLTDSTVLATSGAITKNNPAAGPQSVNLNYVATAGTVGDALQVRWIQSSTTSTARDFAVDNFSVVPEPSTFVLASLGLVAIGSRRARRQG